MNKYSFIILDDDNRQNGSAGWKRVFDLFLIPKNYIIQKSSDIKLVDDSTFIGNTYPIDVQFFKPENDNYTTIYEKISKEDFQSKKDIYFIDMDWDNTKSIKNTNIIIGGLEDVTFEDIRKGKLPSILAGLNLLNILPQDSKPKIVFSGSNKTEDIRKVFELLSKRVLINDILIGEMTGSGENNYINDVEQKVDNYLQSRQISVINRQTAEKIQELSKIVIGWNKDIENIDNADNPLIPDNENTNLENCWSLRSLFPKQVNCIQLRERVPENINNIYEVLNELNFRKIYKWLIGVHGGIRGASMVELTESDDGFNLIINRLKALKYIESSPTLRISEKASQLYKKFSDIILIDNIEEKEFIKKLIKMCVGSAEDIREFIGSKFKSEETLNLNIEYIVDGKKEIKNLFHKEIIKELALKFGLYIGDIFFSYSCIKTSNKQNFSSFNIIPEDYCPELIINIHKDSSNLFDIATISIIVKSDSEFYNTLLDNNPINIIKNRIEKTLKTHLFDINLQEQSMGDYVCLFSNRYNAKIEIQLGKKRLIIDSDKNIVIEDAEFNKTEYVFTINAI